MVTYDNFKQSQLRVRQTFSSRHYVRLSYRKYDVTSKMGSAIIVATHFRAARLYSGLDGSTAGSAGFCAWAAQGKGADAGLLLVAGVGAPFAGLCIADGLGAVAGFLLLAVGLGVDVGVGVCEEVACPGALIAEAAAVAFGARVVVATLAFVAGTFFAGAVAFFAGAVAFFAGAVAFFSSPTIAELADLDVRVFGPGLTAFATVESFSKELAVAVFVGACLDLAAEAIVAFGFFTASLTVSLTALAGSLVA